MTLSEKVKNSASRTVFTIYKEGLFAPLDSGLIDLGLFFNRAILRGEKAI